MTKFYVGEVREVHETGGGDPGWGHTPGHPGNRPPGSWGGPVDPGWGGGPPVHVGGGPLPPPIPGIWPPLSPERPVQPLPPESGWAPGTIWPGAHPPRPDNSLPGGRPPHISGQPVPPPGGSTLPEEPPPNTKPEKFVVLCWISGGIGWNYVVVDTSLKPGNELPEEPVPEPK